MSRKSRFIARSQNGSPAPQTKTNTFVTGCQSAMVSIQNCASWFIGVPFRGRDLLPRGLSARPVILLSQTGELDRPTGAQLFSGQGNGGSIQPRRTGTCFLLSSRRYSKGTSLTLDPPLIQGGLGCIDPFWSPRRLSDSFS